MLVPKLSLLVTGLLAAVSCTVDIGPPPREVSYYDASGNVVYVDETPPPPRAEKDRGPAPSPHHVWIDGYWTRRGPAWVWIEGRWAPKPGAVWVPGHWEYRPRGMEWVSGYWQ